MPLSFTTRRHNRPPQGKPHQNVLFRRRKIEGYLLHFPRVRCRKLRAVEFDCCIYIWSQLFLDRFRGERDSTTVPGRRFSREGNIGYRNPRKQSSRSMNEQVSISSESFTTSWPALAKLDVHGNSRQGVCFGFHRNRLVCSRTPKHFDVYRKRRSRSESFSREMFPLPMSPRNGDVAESGRNTALGVFPISV